MLMTPIQMVAGIIAVIGVIRSLMLLKERKLSAGWFVFWLAVWAGIGIIAFVPSLSYAVSQPLGIERGVDLLVYLSIIVLFYLIFRIFVRLEQSQREITRLVRELAI